MTDAYWTEVKQGGASRKEQQANQQVNPGKEPNWQAPRDPPSRHLATVRCEQRQLDGRVAAHSGGFTLDHKKHQGVDDGQQGNSDGGDGEEGHGAPRALLTSSQREEEEDADQQGGQLIVTEGVQEHICCES